MNKPAFITITGLDQQTDLTRVRMLSFKYPVEWGVLFSRNKQGVGNRYPSFEVINTILQFHDELCLSAHLCGQYTQHLMKGALEFTPEEEDILEQFSAWQINHTNPDIELLNLLSASRSRDIIAQYRGIDSFPDWGLVAPLFDTSGGKGLEPELLPVSLTDDLVGYAGGISPNNIRDFNSRVFANNYWLDMESGVRTDDWLDLDKVEQVLYSIYSD